MRTEARLACRRLASSIDRDSHAAVASDASSLRFGILLPTPRPVHYDIQSGTLRGQREQPLMTLPIFDPTQNTLIKPGYLQLAPGPSGRLASSLADGERVASSLRREDATLSI